MSIAVLSIDLEARLAGLQAGLEKAGQLAEQQGARMQAAFTAAGAALGALAGGAVIGAYLQQSRAAIDLADKVDDLAEKYGIAAGKLSQYRYASEVAGTPTDELAKGLQKLSKAASEGNKGLELIGIGTKAAGGALKSADTLLLEVADKFSQYEDGAAKAALAQEIFGKSGADLIPLLNKGRDGIQGLRDEAIKLGAAFGDDVAKAAGDFNDNLKRIELSVQGAKVALVGEFLPTLNLVLEKVIAASKAFGGFWSGIGNVGFDILGAAVPLKEFTTEFEANGRRIAKVQALLDSGRTFTFESTRKGYQDEIKKLQDRNAELSKYINFAKESQRIDALAGSGGVLDARDARAKGGPKLTAPILSDGKNAEEAKKQYDALIDSIRKKKTEAEAELATGQKLTEQQKFSIDILNKLASAESKLSPAQKDAVRAELERAGAVMKSVEVLEAKAKVVKFSLDLETKVIEGYTRETEALINSNKALEQQVEAYGLSARALETLSLRRLDDELAQQRLLLLSAQSVEGNQAEADAIERKLNVLQRQRDLTAQLTAKQRATREDPTVGATQAVQDFLQRTVDAGEAAKSAISGALSTLENDLVNGLAGGKLEVRGFIDYMIKEFLRLQVVKPLLNDLIGAKGASGGGGLIGSLMSIFGFAKGGAFVNGVQAFASGGVVTRPNLFAMANGRTGLMGEAGPEAIMPLKRGRDGKLGVAGAGGGTVINNYNVAAGVTRNELVSALQVMGQTIMGQTDAKLRRAGIQ